MRVLELGSYVSVAYAGMILAEQGHQVTKWINPGDQEDPILGLIRGHELWGWINAGKTLVRRHAGEVADFAAPCDVVLDNIRPEAWERWGVDPAKAAEELGVTWVSLRADCGGRSFDAIAQAQAWGDHIGYVPAYIGDTAAGLWMAFKALAAPPGWHVLYQSTCLAKLVEGELVVPARRDGESTPWDEPGSYGQDGLRTGARVVYRDEVITEPYRDDQWRWEHLHHRSGRYAI